MITWSEHCTAVLCVSFYMDKLGSLVNLQIRYFTSWKLRPLKMILCLAAMHAFIFNTPNQVFFWLNQGVTLFFVSFVSFYQQIFLTIFHLIPFLLSNFIVLNYCDPAGIYLLRVNNRNTRKRFEICSKLTIKILVSLLLTLNIFRTLF